MSKEQLAAAHSDPAWRAKLVRVAYLSDLLGSCIIFSDYRVPDDLAGAIMLSPEGSRILNEAVSKKKIPAKDAKLMCFLELFHRELLIDIDDTNLENLEKAIGQQIRNFKIRFAPTVGRLLYDRAAELFEDVEDYLTVTQTADLLEGLPQGVAQFGPYLVGPRGLYPRGFNRSFNVSRYAIPLFHCSDPSCGVVHPASLSTDWDAPINENRNDFKRIVERAGKDPSDWIDFIGDLVDSEFDQFDDSSLNTFPYFFGEVFSEAEMRLLLTYELESESRQKQSRAGLAELGLKNVGPVGPITAAPSHYELIQYFLMRADLELVELIDEAVNASAIHIPPDEIRAMVVSKHRRSPGPFGAQIELNNLGCRVVTRQEIGPRRLVRLIHAIYPIDSVEQENELEWLLRDVEGASIRGRLEDFLRTGAPAEILRSLVLCKRANVVIACHQLGIDDLPRPDDELMSRMLWKLGFEIVPDDRDRATFWRLHQRLEQVAHTATASGFVNYESLRAQCGAYFPELERVLLDALLYTTWALLYDHFSAERPFTYTPDQHRLWAMTELNNQFEFDENAELVAPFAEDAVTLGPMIDGFRVLADRLATVMAERSEHERSESEYPKFVKYTNLQDFPFKHSRPILDLEVQAAEKLITLLQTVGTELISAEVAAVRNEQAHYRRQRSTRSMERLENMMRVVRSIVTRLERNGCVRLRFRRVASQSDEWGRRTHLLADEIGREYALTTPSEYSWMQLPALDQPQYVFQGATIRDPNEVLRFNVQPTSEYFDLWQNFPKRRRRRAPIAPMPVRQEARVTTAVGEVQAD